MKNNLFLLIAALLVASSAHGQKVYHASQFGITPDSGVNASPLVQRALETIKAEQQPGETVILRFKEGVYDFLPEGAQQREYYISNHDQNNPKTVAIVVEGMENLILDGGGSDFRFHGRMIPVAVLHTKNCTLRNFSVDNPNPQISQVEVIANDSDSITYRVAPWVKYRIDSGRLVAYGQGWEHSPGSGIAFEQKTKRLVFNTSDIEVGVKNIQEIAPGLLRAPWKNDKLIPGTVVALRSWHRPTPGIFLSHNKDTRLENIRVHYAEGMGLLAQMCENITLNKFSVCLRGANDPRYFTTQADATHFSACKGLIRSEGGLYEGMMDDAINIHGTYLKVVKRLSDRKLVGRYMHPQAYGFEWGTEGDTVQFVAAKTMEIAGGVNVVTAIRPYDKEQITGAKEYEITFAEPLDPAIGTEGDFGIENLEWTPRVIFSHNVVRNNRARGALFSTPRETLVEGNLFDHTSGTAILLCGDCNGWYETGACRSVVIRGNTFVNALTNLFQFTNAVISIYPEIPDLEHQQRYFHSGIVIEDNLFETFDAPILYARSVDGLVFRRNRIRTNRDYPAFHWNRHRILLERVAAFTMENNKFEGGFDPQKDLKQAYFD